MRRGGPDKKGSRPPPRVTTSPDQSIPIGAQSGQIVARSSHITAQTSHVVAYSGQAAHAAQRDRLAEQADRRPRRPSLHPAKNSLQRTGALRALKATDARAPTRSGRVKNQGRNSDDNRDINIYIYIY